MTIAVHERTPEFCVLCALGARRKQILGLLLSAAVILAAIGGLAGLVLGIGGAQLLHLLIPALPVHTPWAYVLLAEAVAVILGLVAGVMPAMRASKMDPVEALRAE